MTKSSKLPVILFTTSLNTLGIGLLIPVFAFLIQQYTSDANQTAFYVGIITATYAFFEFLAAPFLGVLSDKYGRKPVLLFSILGSAIGYVFLGIGGSLAMLFLGRIIDGISAGNITSIFAYVGDISKPEESGKNFGLVGAALGVGFLIGPTLGGLLATFGLYVPMYLAAFVNFLNLILVYFLLPESHNIKNRISSFGVKDLNPFGIFFDIKTNQYLKTILIAAFFHFVAFAQLIGNGSVITKDALNWSPLTVGLSFLVIGIGDVIMQGFLIEKLIPKFGTQKLAIYGLFITTLTYLSLALLPVIHSTLLAFISFIIFSFGTGLFEPSMASMVSRSAPNKEQGKTQGAYQALQSLTRFIGPLLAAFLYQLSWSLPYILNIAFAVISGYLFISFRQSKIAEDNFKG